MSPKPRYNEMTSAKTEITLELTRAKTIFYGHPDVAPIYHTL